jgi:hypothetical protein
MRRFLLAPVVAVTVSAAAFIGGAAPEGNATVGLRLVDATTGEAVGGMVRIRAAGRDQPLTLPRLLDRMRGLERSEVRAGWHVVPVRGAALEVPRQKLTLEAIHGLESARATLEVDMTKSAPAELTVKLPMLFRPAEQDLAAGNTHLHLRDMTRSEADDYLRQIPAADGLRVLFISYLERHLDDRSYITNNYPIGDLDFPGAGTLYSNGEEHRHNFDGFGQGYGHVMFLAIKRLVQPVSLGPGITKAGNDDLPLRSGIDNARKQGGTVIWCHNTFGHEDVPNMLAGRLDALNVFDGSRKDAYEDTYYRFLNLGLRVPLSTGTDWFLYDFARVYVRAEKNLSIAGWLDGLKKGRTLATNGPLVTLTVAGRPPGDVLALDQPKPLRAEARAVGRHNFGKLQLVRNGTVIHQETAQPVEGGFTAKLARTVTVDEPAWFAARIETAVRNEFDQPLFAHTSPVYANLSGRRVFDVESARALLQMVEQAVADIRARGRFSSDAARDRLLVLYTQAANDLRARINNRGR